MIQIKTEAEIALMRQAGLVVGRTLLYPQDDNPVQAVDVAAQLVHRSS